MRDEVRQPPAKKDYAAPVLVEYGPVAKLTQNGGVSGTDAMAMMA